MTLKRFNTKLKKRVVFSQNGRQPKAQDFFTLQAIEYKQY